MRLLIHDIVRTSSDCSPYAVQDGSHEHVYLAIRGGYDLSGRLSVRLLLAHAIGGDGSAVVPLATYHTRRFWVFDCSQEQ